MCRDLKASPGPPGGERSNSPIGNTLHSVFAVTMLGVGKLFWIKVGLVPPERPQRFEDFALGVEPRMGGGT